MDQFSRTQLLIGSDALKKIKSSHVAIFGVGGVGSYAIESLARSGIGTFSIFDNDVVSISNINRQLIATHKTIGMYKVDVMKERILDINPNAVIHTYNCFFSKDTINEIDFLQFDYIVDAIDTVTSKILLIQKAKELNIDIISSMGAGNKLDPTRFVVGDIYETSICRLAKVMRKELRARSVDSLKVVYSTETAAVLIEKEDIPSIKQVPGSVSFVPSVVGLIISGEVLKDIISWG